MICNIPLSLRSCNLRSSFLWGQGTSYNHIKRLYTCICVCVCVCMFKAGFICLPVTGQEFQYCKNIIVFQCIHKFNGILVQNWMEIFEKNLEKNWSEESKCVLSSQKTLEKNVEIYLIRKWMCFKVLIILTMWCWQRN